MGKAKTVKKHTTEEVIILKASIDKAIVPVVNWLNDFSSVVTQYCCEGHDGNWDSKPYVIFTASCIQDLMDITRKTDGFADIVINCSEGLLPLRFWLKFGNKKLMKSFISIYLEKR